MLFIDYSNTNLDSFKFIFLTIWSMKLISNVFNKITSIYFKIIEGVWSFILSRMLVSRKTKLGFEIPCLNFANLVPRINLGKIKFVWKLKFSFALT